MAGRRGRIGPLCIAAGAVLLVLALTACNPLVEQTTVGSEGIPPWVPPSSGSDRIDFAGTRSGWLEVRIVDAVAPAVAISGQYRNPETSDCGELPWTVAWSEGASRGFQRLIRIDPGDQFVLHASGSSDPIRFDVRVVDDAGVPVGDLTRYVPPEGGFPDVGWAICSAGLDAPTSA